MTQASKDKLAEQRREHGEEPDLLTFEWFGKEMTVDLTTASNQDLITILIQQTTPDAAAVKVLAIYQERVTKAYETAKAAYEAADGALGMIRVQRNDLTFGSFLVKPRLRRTKEQIAADEAALAAEKAEAEKAEAAEAVATPEVKA